MCGIVAVISEQEISETAIRDMNSSQNHRGPDASGVWLHQLDNGINIGLGHVRLSILDLTEDGNQPMEYLNRYKIVFNGEIFNYIELRKELIAKGYKFKSETDTEVLIAAYDAWGDDCLQKLNGMWAFLIYDKRKKKVFISRDRFGIKPLYFFKKKSVIVIASEIKSLLANKLVTREPNKARVKDYIKGGPKEHREETDFKDIYRFKSNHYVTFDLKEMNNEFRPKKYWDFEVNKESRKFCEKEAILISRKYYELLMDSIAIRMRSDVTFGAALSGGLDSSSIVHGINEILKTKDKQERVCTFSTIHKKKESLYCDESKFIDLVAKEYNVKSHKVEPVPEDVPIIHKDTITSHENLLESLGMGGMYTSKLIKSKGVTVTLDGQGADEQQAGYPRYIPNYLCNISIFKLPYEAFCLLRKIGAPEHVRRGVLLNIIRSFGLKKVFIKSIKVIFKKDAGILFEDLNERLKKDTMGELQNLLHYSDSRSMHYSLEARMPFMDYRLVEFTAKIPVVYKIRHGWTKYFARLAFDEKLPDEITWRKDKMGWPIPLEYWLKGPLKKYFLRNTKNNKLLTELDIDIHLNKLLKRESAFTIIRYLNIAVWYENFFGNSKFK